MKRALVFVFLAALFSCKNNQQPGAQQKTAPPPVHTDSVTACILSQIAYCNQPQRLLDSFLPGWTVTWNPVPINGNYAFAARNHNTVAVAIRGSVMEFSEAAFQNWVYQDLNALRQNEWTYADSVTGAKVSAGAYEGWENLTRLKDTTTGKSLWMVLREMQNTNPVLITGHSLGGKLATVYASWLKWNYRETKTPAQEINVITFAAPAAGNKKFAEAFNQAFPLARRFENTHDMVPKFPSTVGIKQLGGLFNGGTSAKDIAVGYKGIDISLASLFGYVADGLRLAGIFTGFSDYEQPRGQLITAELSAPRAAPTLNNWFAEAGYQHGVQLYAKELGAPVISCAEK